MANIEEYLNEIRTAIYGRQVRSSIADGIEAINNEVKNNTEIVINNVQRQDELENKQNNLEESQTLLEGRQDDLEGRQDNLENRVDDIIAGTTDSAEIIDARTNVFGEKFSTLGKRISETDKIAYSAYSIPHTSTNEIRTLRIRNFGDSLSGTVVGSVSYFPDNRGLIIADVGVNDNSYPFNFTKVGAV